MIVRFVKAAVRDLPWLGVLASGGLFLLAAGAFALDGEWRAATFSVWVAAVHAASLVLLAQRDRARADVVAGDEIIGELYRALGRERRARDLAAAGVAYWPNIDARYRGGVIPGEVVDQ